MGDVVNVASRLQTMAPPGSVYIGDSTAALASDEIVRDLVDDIFVTGREQTERVWNVTGLHRRLPTIGTRTDVPFVGRANQRELLASVMTMVANGRSAVVAVTGEAGSGKTRLVNVYRVQRGSAEPRYLVDLPGYGYARASKGTSGQSGRDTAAAEINALTEAYFGRPGERAVILLVDSRHPGLASDMDAWEWIRSQPFARRVVATKADKLTRADRARHVREFETLFDMPVALVSARTGEGLDDLWKMIASLPNRTAA